MKLRKEINHPSEQQGKLKHETLTVHIPKFALLTTQL